MGGGKPWREQGGSGWLTRSSPRSGRAGPGSRTPVDATLQRSSTNEDTTGHRAESSSTPAHALEVHPTCSLVCSRCRRCCSSSRRCCWSSDTHPRNTLHWTGQVLFRARTAAEPVVLLSLPGSASISNGDDAMTVARGTRSTCTRSQI